MKFRARYLLLSDIALLSCELWLRQKHRVVSFIEKYISSFCRFSCKLIFAQKNTIVFWDWATALSWLGWSNLITRFTTESFVSILLSSPWTWYFLITAGPWLACPRPTNPRRRCTGWRRCWCRPACSAWRPARGRGGSSGGGKNGHKSIQELLWLSDTLDDLSTLPPSHWSSK